jgi:hypothetical protein
MMPTAASEYLYGLAQQVARPYAALSSARAAMVTGSVAKGIADNYSDVDMSVFYEEYLPEDETLHAIRKETGGSDRKWTSGSLADGGFVEAFDLAGVEVQLIHTTIAAWEATMAELLTNLKVDTPLPKALEGILICRPLYGEPYVEAWKAQAAAFPPALAEAMVLHYLKFFPIWGLLPHFQTRDATVWYHQILVESAYNLLGILAGLNRVYFTTFQFKRMDRFVAQLDLAPADLGRRIEALFHTTPELAASALERLVDETLALVETHMPQIDTSPGRRRIGWRNQPWRLQEPELPQSG